MKKNLFIALLTVCMLSACSEYQQILKSTDRAAKMEYAMRMYEKKKYSKATVVFEELYTTSRGNADAEKIEYYFAKSYYGAGDYLLASYFFEDFLSKYRFSKYEEDAAYSNAMCYYRDSPENTLDQTNTYRAINQFQTFVNQYPESPLVAECNKRIDELRAKLETKAYRVAYQYYRMEYYQASSTAFILLLKDFPDTDKRDRCSYFVIKSCYLLAINSVKSKKKERLEEVLKNYDKFAANIKDVKDRKEIDAIKAKAALEFAEVVKLEEAERKAALEAKNKNDIRIGKQKKVKKVPGEKKPKEKKPAATDKKKDK